MAGIYLHIPFCDTKCIYCDFYSITNHSHKNEFLSALKDEILSKSEMLKDRKFNSIFLGGGTPSLLSYAELNDLFAHLFKFYNISNDSEITIEANPGTLNNTKLKEIINLPVNRISFGVQSFIDEELKFLTRIHTANEARESIKNAMNAGFENVNLDLIFALPGQSIDNWKYNLDEALKLGTKHISTYSLIFEKGTALYTMRKKGEVNNADIELEQQMYEYTMEFLEFNGYMQYEISNYAKPGYECRHNLKYWTLEEYIALGPSASSFIGNKRWTNTKNLGKYIELAKAGKPVYDFIETIDKDTAITEHIMLGLRSKGIYFEDFKQRHCIDFKSTFKSSINTLTKNSWAILDNEKLKLTRKGYALCDEIVTTLF